MAGIGRTAVEAVKHALYKQSYGGALGRFYVQRTLEHLLQCSHYFREDVKEVKANIPSSASHSFRRFMFENIPQLKYRNPTTLFDCKFDDGSQPFLKIVFADGKEQSIEVEQKQSEIYNTIVELTKNSEDDSLDNVAEEDVK